jgi:hypothetical protein
MRIPLENIKDAFITEEEVYDSLPLSLYVNNLNPLLAIWLFSSSHSCSCHFKKYDCLKSFLCCCQVFGATFPTQFLILLFGKNLVQLQLPEMIIALNHKDRVLIMEALCLVLICLSYPCHWFVYRIILAGM